MLKKSLPEISYLALAVILVMLSFLSSGTFQITFFSLKIQINEFMFFIFSGFLFLYYAGVAWELNKKNQSLDDRYFKIHYFISLISILLVVILGYALTRNSGVSTIGSSLKRTYIMNSSSALGVIFYISLLIAILVQLVFMANVMKSKQQYKSKRRKRRSSGKSRSTII